VWFARHVRGYRKNHIKRSAEAVTSDGNLPFVLDSFVRGNIDKRLPIREHIVSYFLKRGIFTQLWYKSYYLESSGIRRHLKNNITRDRTHSYPLFRFFLSLSLIAIIKLIVFNLLKVLSFLYTYI